MDRPAGSAGGTRKKGAGRPTSSAVPGTQPIASLQWRTRARVAGRVKSIRVQPLSDVPTIECVVMDDSGEAITFVFLGRRSIGGLRSGTHMVAEGMVGKHKGKLAMINPSYEVLVSGSAEDST
jgi:RecG-like helicase